MRKVTSVDAKSQPTQIYVFEAAIIHPPQRPGWRDINVRLEEVERDPRRAEAIARARQKLATSCFKERTLSAIRLEKGLSQAQLARRIDTSQSRLSRIEAGLDDPRLSTVRKLAEALGESVSSISDAIGRASRGCDE